MSPTSGSDLAVPLPRTDDLHTVKPWALKVLHPLGSVLLRRWWRIGVHGAQHVPTGGPVILVANHLAFLDGPLLGWMTSRPTFALAKTELFHGVLGRFLLLTGQIPIDRRRPQPDVIRRCIKVLRDGQIMVVFPEGRRGLGDVADARPGAAYLGLVTGAPIVPVALLGTRQPGQGTGTLPQRGTRMAVVFGEPIQPPLTPWPRRRDDVNAWSEHLRGILAEHVRAAQQLTGLPLPGPIPSPTPSAAG